MEPLLLFLDIFFEVKRINEMWKKKNPFNLKKHR